MNGNEKRLKEYLDHCIEDKRRFLEDHGIIDERIPDRLSYNTEFSEEEVSAFCDRDRPLMRLTTATRRYRAAA